MGIKGLVDGVNPRRARLALAVFGAAVAAVAGFEAAAADSGSTFTVNSDHRRARRATRRRLVRDGLRRLHASRRRARGQRPPGRGCHRSPGRHVRDRDQAAQPERHRHGRHRHHRQRGDQRGRRGVDDRRRRPAPARGAARGARARPHLRGDGRRRRGQLLGPDAERRLRGRVRRRHRHQQHHGGQRGRLGPHAQRGGQGGRRDRQPRGRLHATCAARA